MDIADEYFNNCRKICVGHPNQSVVEQLMGKRVRYKVFARQDGVLVGVNRAVNFIQENTYGPVKIIGLKDGAEFYSEVPVLEFEINFTEGVTLETTYLGFMSYSGAATVMRDIVCAANGVPVVDMSARHFPWEIIEQAAAAAYHGGAAGTSTQAGYNYVQKWYGPGEDFKLYASIPHAMAALVAGMSEEAGLFPSVLAAKLFHERFPEKPLTVLVDYEGRELDVARQAFEVFGDKLFAVRLDTHGGRMMQGCEFPSAFSMSQTQEDKMLEYYKEKVGGSLFKLIKDHNSKFFSGNGVTIEANYRMRDFLDSIGARDTKIVVSSGFNAKKVAAFNAMKAPMDSIGTGSWVKFEIFTSDISHVFENGQWVQRNKVGRDHKEANGLEVLFERK